MTRFIDTEGNFITEATETIIIKFHDRFVINNYPFGCNVGDKVFVFDQENLDKFWEYHDDKIFQSREELINLTKESIEMSKNAFERIDELKQENDNLRKLNNELSETIVQLKEK